MSDTEVLLERATRFATAASLSLSTVSLRILNDGKGLKRIRGGAGITVRKLQEATEALAKLEQELASNQPVDADSS